MLTYLNSKTKLVSIIFFSQLFHVFLLLLMCFLYECRQCRKKITDIESTTL